jgi:hypothetical protein
MNLQEIASLSKKSREDGKRLFSVCDLIYKIAIVCIWFFAIIGAIAAFSMINTSPKIGIAIALLVAAICLINYMIAVLMTHVAKVLVHTSFANIGILEHLTESKLKDKS